MMYKDYKKPAYEWLPDIPHHWQELFIQQVSHEQKNKNTGNIEGLVLSLSYGNIIRKKNVDAGLVAKDLSTYQIVDKNNIILRFTDLQNDHKSLRTGLVKERGIITSAFPKPPAARHHERPGRGSGLRLLAADLLHGHGRRPGPLCLHALGAER